MGIESRVTGTGPLGATMAPMAVDLTFNGVAFGRLRLPEVKTSSRGTDVNIYDQHIDISDMAAFKAFVKSLMKDEHLVLTLDKGDCTIKALGLTAHCTYRKDIHLKGMNGPQSRIIDTDETTNTVAVHNPSPLEIDHGVSMFEIRDAAGNPEKIAELKGPMEIKRGYFELKMNLSRTANKPQSGSTAYLIGIGTENDAWTNDTLKYINTRLELTDKFCSMY
jgi:hypothetical protein